MREVSSSTESTMTSVASVSLPPLPIARPPSSSRDGSSARAWRPASAMLSCPTLCVLGLFACFLVAVDVVCLRSLWAEGGGEATGEAAALGDADSAAGEGSTGSFGGRVMVPRGVPPLFSTVSRVHAAAFHVAFSMALVSYVAACLREPGAVPLGYPFRGLEEVEGEEPGGDVLEAVEEGEVHQQRANSQNKLRTCKHCKHAKPPRTHHCRVCRACVLRMDHHCGWLDTCVGHRNYKAFVCFLGWTLVALCDASYILGRTLATGTLIRRNPARPGTVDVVMYLTAGEMSTVVAALIFGVGLAVGVGFLGLYHAHLLGANLTTIEMHDRETPSRKSRKASGEGNPYDLGSWMANARDILGPNPLTWVVPTASHGDGVVHRARRMA